MPKTVPFSFSGRHWSNDLQWSLFIRYPPPPHHPQYTILLSVDCPSTVGDLWVLHSQGTPHPHIILIVDCLSPVRWSAGPPERPCWWPHPLHISSSSLPLTAQVKHGDLWVLQSGYADEVTYPPPHTHTHTHTHTDVDHTIHRNLYVDIFFLESSVCTFLMRFITWELVLCFSLQHGNFKWLKTEVVPPSGNWTEHYDWSACLKQKCRLAMAQSTPQRWKRHMCSLLLVHLMPTCTHKIENVKKEFSGGQHSDMIMSTAA